MAAKKKPAPKRGASRYQAPAKQPIPGWLWMAIGLTVGAFIVFLMKLEPGKGSESVKREKIEQQKATKIAEANKTPPSPTQPVKPKYDFYTLLPESEVIVPPEAVPEKTLPTPQTAPVAPVTPAEAAKIDTARAQAALSGVTPPPAPPVAKAAPVTKFFLQGRFVPQGSRCRQGPGADHSAGPGGIGGVRHREGRDLVSSVGRPVQQPRTTDHRPETTGWQRFQQSVVTTTPEPLTPDDCSLSMGAICFCGEGACSRWSAQRS